MLEPVRVSSSQESQALIARIAGLIHRGEAKIVKGSLSGDPVMDLEFKVKATNEKWVLRGILDVHGGLILSRVS